MISRTVERPYVSVSLAVTAFIFLLIAVVGFVRAITGQYITGFRTTIGFALAGLLILASAYELRPRR